MPDEVLDPGGAGRDGGERFGGGRVLPGGRARARHRAADPGGRRGDRDRGDRGRSDRQTDVPGDRAACEHACTCGCSGVRGGSARGRRNTATRLLAVNSADPRVT
nr:hypothetical protein KPHV_84360 [Kitasatospora purpeofusca]